MLLFLLLLSMFEKSLCHRTLDAISLYISLLYIRTRYLEVCILLPDILFKNTWKNRMPVDNGSLRHSLNDWNSKSQDLTFWIRLSKTIFSSISWSIPMHTEHRLSIFSSDFIISFSGWYLSGKEFPKFNFSLTVFKTSAYVSYYRKISFNIG